MRFMASDGSQFDSGCSRARGVLRGEPASCAAGLSRLGISALAHADERRFSCVTSGRRAARSGAALEACTASNTAWDPPSRCHQRSTAIPNAFQRQMQRGMSGHRSRRQQGPERTGGTGATLGKRHARRYVPALTDTHRAGRPCYTLLSPLNEAPGCLTPLARQSRFGSRNAGHTSHGRTAAWSTLLQLSNLDSGGASTDAQAVRA